MVPEAIEFAFDVLKRRPWPTTHPCKSTASPAIPLHRLRKNLLIEEAASLPPCKGMLILGVAGGELELAQLEIYLIHHV